MKSYTFANTSKVYQNELKAHISAFEDALSDASNGVNLEQVHTTATTVCEYLHSAVNKGNIHLKKGADALERVLQSGGTTQSKHHRVAANVIISAIKVALNATELEIHEGMADIEKVIHSAVDTVDIIVGVPSGTSSITEATETAMNLGSNTLQATQTLGSLPFRIVARTISTAIETFVSNEPKSHVLTIARAAMAAIEAATNTETPLKAASEAFTRTIQETTDGSPPDDIMLKMVKNMTETVERLQENAPSSLMIYDFMIQALAWTWELNRLVKKYPRDEPLCLAAEKVGKAMVKMQKAIEEKLTVIEEKSNKD